MSTYSINGTIVTKENATTSILDRGLLYGDGIFEGIRMYNKYLFKLEEHMNRLYESATLIDLEIDIPKEQFIKEILKTAAHCEEDSAYVRVTVSREGAIGLHTTSDLKINRSVIVTPLNYQAKDTYDKGLHLVRVSRTRIPEEALPMRAKTLGYLNNILAVNEAKRKGASDALLLNTKGFVAESSGSNVFYIKGNELVTPHPNVGILIGITRNCILELAKEKGMQVVEKPFTYDELLEAEEIFLTGTAMEMMPVYQIDETLIGDGTPGTKTKELMKDFKKHIQEVPGMDAKNYK